MINVTDTKDYDFTGYSGQARFLASYLEVLKEDNPILHEKICAKQREMMQNIVPGSGRGPTFIELIKDVLQVADKKRFYQVQSDLKRAINE